MEMGKLSMFLSGEFQIEPMSAGGYHRASVRFTWNDKQWVYFSSAQRFPDLALAEAMRFALEDWETRIDKKEEAENV